MKLSSRANLFVLLVAYFNICAHSLFAGGSPPLLLLGRGGSQLHRHGALRSKQESSADDFLSQMANAINTSMPDTPLAPKTSRKELIKSWAGDYNQAAVKAELQAFIDENPLFMLSMTTCPFCVKTRSILDEVGAAYRAVDLDELESQKGYALRAEMAELTDRTSVPAVWIGGEFVGGCTDGPMGGGGVTGLQESGKLVEMLSKAGGSL